MFVLGAWKNFDEFEECMTLDDLTAAYTQIVENKFDRMDFEAKLQGVDIKKPNIGSNTETSKKQEDFNNRVREKMDSQNLQKARSGQNISPAQGVGYKVIGG